MPYFGSELEKALGRTAPAEGRGRAQLSYNCWTRKGYSWFLWLIIRHSVGAYCESSRPSLVPFALVGSGEAAGRGVGCLSARTVGQVCQAQAANPDCSAGFVARGKRCGFESRAGDAPWRSVWYHAMLQGGCPGKPAPLQSSMMPGTRREARGESVLGSGVHYLALWIVSLAAAFSSFL